MELYTSKRNKTEWDFILIYTHKLKTASSVFTELIGRAFNLISGHDSSPKDVCDDLILQGTVSHILSMSQ